VGEVSGNYNQLGRSAAMQNKFPAKAQESRKAELEEFAFFFFFAPLRLCGRTAALVDDP
jgi:hypothetical protein